MTLEELIEAQLDGQSPEVPEELRAEFERAMAAHRALGEVVDETLVEPSTGAEDRLPPALPADYEVERELGRGGMGVVYLVRQKSLGRDVALKVLRPGEQAFGPLLKRFQDEARHLARLRHPNIVSIHEVGDAEGEPYFTMDYIAGESLATVLQRGALSPTQAVASLKEVTSAIQHAHSQGIIHRDLKPSNVLIDADGHAYVTDFGLARDVTQAVGHTQTGAILGTPQYMAPEQALGQSDRIGEATDLHGLGMLLYEMLTGRPPYGSDAAARVVVRLLHEEPKPLRQLDSRIPRDLETICLKALQKRPEDRYPTATALQEDLRRFEAGESILARRQPLWRKAVRTLRRHAWQVALGAAVMVIGALLLVVMQDRSVQQLVLWGNLELQEQRPLEAISYFERALKAAGETERPEVLSRLSLAIQLLSDEAQAIQRAVELVGTYPELSFGSRDYLVAQALATRERARQQSGGVKAHEEQRISLAERRLEQFVEGKTGTEEQRQDALRLLSLFRTSREAIGRPVNPLDGYVATLPTGSVDELTALATDGWQSAWVRAKAAYVLAKECDAAGNAEEARRWARTAVELAARIYPYYSGIRPRITTIRPQPDANVDAPECVLVREMAELRTRLDGDFPLPRGAVRVRINGVPIPPEVDFKVMLDLTATDLTSGERGQVERLNRALALEADGTATVGVLNGRYRVRLLGTSNVVDATQFGDLTQRLRSDWSDWPSEIEVKGETVELPPLRIWLADIMKLTSPASLASVDLRSEVFRWEPVANAMRYRLHCYLVEETPAPTQRWLAFAPQTTATAVCLGALPREDQAKLRAELLAGRTLGWRVQAEDATGRTIGESQEQRLVTITHGLDE